MHPVADVDQITDEELTDEELTELALAADPDRPLDPDAIPIGEYLAQEPGLLPSWYMAAVTARAGANRWRAVIILAVVAAFVTIEAFGLCSTYGPLSLG
jgi:hypothetical protein